MARLDEEKKETQKPDATQASVLDANDGHVRTYTKEVHGEDFHDLAKEMLAQRPGGRIILQ
jgi:hypothetical protein